MKTFAEIDSNNIVQNVIQAKDDATPESLKQSDQLITGVKFLESKTDGTLRVRNARIGGLYNETDDRFEDLQPHPSWTQTANGDWEAPVAKPTEEQSADRFRVSWDESLQKWVSPLKSEVEASDGTPVPNYYWDNDTENWILIT